MNDKQDPRQADLERELYRYMLERRMTRRMLLEQIAKSGKPLLKLGACKCSRKDVTQPFADKPDQECQHHRYDENGYGVLASLR